MSYVLVLWKFKKKKSNVVRFSVMKFKKKIKCLYVLVLWKFKKKNQMSYVLSVMKI